MSPAVDPKTLTALASFDSKVHNFKMAIAAGRQEERGFELLEAEYLSDVENAKSRLTESKLNNRKLDSEMDDLHKQVKLHNGHLNEISDTREYRALGDEIRYLRRQIEAKEEVALTTMETIEKIEKELESAQKDLQEKREEIKSKCATISQERNEFEDNLKQANSHFEQFLTQVDPATVSFYKRRAARQEMPVVWSRKDACGYCHHKLTPQARLEVMNAKKLIICESCGRIIVAGEDESSVEAS